MKLRSAYAVFLGALTLCLFAGCPSDSDIGGGSGTSATDSTTGAPPAQTSSGPAESSSGPPEDPPTAGSACGGPLGGSFADCVNGNTIACLNEESTCLVNNISAPVWGACTLACEDECDCWAAPATGSAVTACAPVLPMGENACILDCNDGRECPDGMRCSALTGVQRICVFDSDDLPSTSSGDESTGPSSGSSSSGGSGSSSSGGSTGSGSLSGA